MRSNCLIWAACAWWRLRKRHVCHLAVRGSRWGPFPHFSLMVRRRDGAFRCIGFKPVAPRPKGIPPPLFVGHMRWGD